MGNIRLYGFTSGYTELAPPAVAPDGVLSLPSGTGTIAKTTDQGLVLISPTSIANSGGTATATGGRVTFTGVTSVSVNGVFSATYDNYYILVTRTAGDSSSMRLRTSGTDNSAASYELRGYYYGAANANENVTSGTSWNIASGSGLAMVSLVLVNPFLASNSFGVEQLHSVTLGETASVVHAVASSFDGFSINGTNQTGTIRVFGYKQT